MGETTAKENEQVDLWRQADEANEKLFLEFSKTLAKSTSHLAGDNPDVSTIDVDAEWKRFEDSIDANQKKATIKPLKPLYAQIWLRVAAGFALVALISIVVVQFIGYSNYETVYAEAGGKQVTLPDGSVITLNANTEITYLKSFEENATRKVELTGEAFFEVERNPEQPFVVQLNEGTVEVLGTSFNIQAYKKMDVIDVVVAAGIVRFGSEVKDESVVLEAGDRGILNKENNQVNQEMNTDVNFLSWKTRQIVFEDMSLDQVIQTLNKLYDANITINAESAENCMVTVTFDHQSLEAILSVLEETLDLTYEENGNNIMIVSTGC